MAMQPYPLIEGWDPFFRQVQQRMVEPLGLENVIISVDRHQGTNGKVGVTLTPHLVAKAGSNAVHHAGLISRRQLTVNQLTVEIQSILEDLLEDCTVRFGDIKFYVNHGLLQETVFSEMTRPHESASKFVTINL